MPLVQYSDSESSDSPQSDQTHSKSQNFRGIKKKHSSTSLSTLPPLPDSFHNLYASTARVSNHDDPALHSGRQRVTPHLEGNWPTHIYIECESVKQSQWLWLLLERWLMVWRVSFNRIFEPSQPYSDQFQQCTNLPRASSAQSSEERTWSRVASSYQSFEANYTAHTSTRALR